MKNQALIVDDEQDIRELIEMSFMGIGINCILSPTIGDGIKQLKNQTVDFVITDMRLPDGNGLDFIAHIQKHYPTLPVCMITAHGNVELAVKALKLGAFDFVNKPFDLRQLRNMAKSALKLTKNSLETTQDNKKKGGNHQPSITIIGDSPVMKKLDEIIKKLARSQAPVFIYGESGTGKELVARSIHILSARRDGPFIPVNCGAIPENLVESEFFGYKKGAFTGATKDALGLFASANGGTIFLDEVADLPLSMQVKLLRAIQERAIRPIGGDVEIPIDVRILSATHKNLTELVENQAFREDLYYRLNVISLGIPPLRKRTGDIALLAHFILDKISNRQSNTALELATEATEKLSQYNFPGNIRELENILERAATFCENATVTANDIHFTSQMIEANSAYNSMSIDLSDGLPDEYDSNAAILEKETQQTEKQAIAIQSNDSKLLSAEEDIDNVEGNLSNYLEDIERKAIENALQSTDNNKTKAAEKLGLSLRALRYKLKKYNIK
ncbi:MAG: sigma-54-dependent transcriptional regulator [Ostreibacterium sp.]